MAAGEPVLLNVAGKASIEGTTLQLADVTGEVGTEVEARVILPADRAIREVRVNGQPHLPRQSPDAS